MMKPFRWNIRKQEQLGRLIKGERESVYLQFLDDLRSCASRLISFSEDGVICFVGRSPESIFDYLSGIFEYTVKKDDLVHLNISNRCESVQRLKKQKPHTYNALKDHFLECSISPREVLQRKKKTFFTDVVCHGGTFNQIIAFLFDWAEDERLCIRDLRLKTGLLGITIREHTSPKTWRWQQRCPWVSAYQVRNIRNVSVPGRFWRYLGNNQEKVTGSNPPYKWGEQECLLPPRAEYHLKALRLALDLYNLGLEQKKEFSKLLCQETATREDWFRRLILELRSVTSRNCVSELYHGSLLPHRQRTPNR